MTKIVVLACFVLALFPEPTRAGPLAPEDNVDKFAHFGLSATLTASALTIGKSQNRFHEVTVPNRLYSSGAVLGLGLYKEFRDLRDGGDPRDSIRDVIADAFGVLVGNLIHWEF